LNSRSIIQNLIASLIVSFVALSLGASFGILSGRTNGAFVGMLSAGVIASITALFGGTRVQCSGPTAPMTAVTAVLVAFAHDKFMLVNASANSDHFINLVLILTGGLLLFMGIFRFGRFIKYVPNVVISGFMTGIAILIWMDQSKKIFGLGGKTAFEGPIMLNFGIAATTLFVIITLPRITKKLIPKYSHYFSPTLLSIVIVTITTNLLSLQVEHVNLNSSIASLADFTAMISAQIPTDWSFDIIKIAAPFALQLAFLAYLDTLLTSLVIDKMSREKTKQNKELIAQGLGNGLVALIGGIPGAQATIRSVLIIKENATLRFAGVMVGVFVFLEIILFKDYINFIPQAVFAGVLFKVGYDVFDFITFRLYAKELKLFKWQLFKDFFSDHTEELTFVSNREMLLIVGTVVVTLFVNLNVAVIAFTAIFYLANKVLWRSNPIRDLKPVVETEAMIGEEIIDDIPRD
jgi:SulP family sulfate permease